MPLDLDPIIEEQIVAPASFSEEGRSETARSIDDLIKIDQYTLNKAARNSRRRGIDFKKQIPAGPMSDQGGTNGGGSFGTCGGCQ